MQNSPPALALLRLKDQSAGLSIISKDVSFSLLCCKRFGNLHLTWAEIPQMLRSPLYRA